MSINFQMGLFDFRTAIENLHYESLYLSLSLKMIAYNSFLVECY